MDPFTKKKNIICFLTSFLVSGILFIPTHAVHASDSEEEDSDVLYSPQYPLEESDDTDQDLNESQKLVVFPLTKLAPELAFQMMIFLPLNDLVALGSTSLLYQKLAEDIFKNRQAMDEPVSLPIPPARQWKISYFLRNLLKDTNFFYRKSLIDKKSKKPYLLRKACESFGYYLKDRTEGFFDFNGKNCTFIGSTSQYEPIQQYLSHMDHSDTFSRELLLHYFLKIWSLSYKETYEDQYGLLNNAKFIDNLTHWISSLITFFAKKHYLKTVHYYTQKIPFPHLLELSNRLQNEHQNHPFYQQLHQQIIDIKFAQATTQQQRFNIDFQIYFQQVLNRQAPPLPLYFKFNAQSDEILKLARPKTVGDENLGVYDQEKVFQKFLYFMATRSEEISEERQKSILQQSANYCRQIFRCFLDTPLVYRNDIYSILDKVEATISLMLG